MVGSLERAECHLGLHRMRTALMTNGAHTCQTQDVPSKIWATGISGTSYTERPVLRPARVLSRSSLFLLTTPRGAQGTSPPGRRSCRTKFLLPVLRLPAAVSGTTVPLPDGMPPDSPVGAKLGLEDPETTRGISTKGPRLTSGMARRLWGGEGVCISCYHCSKESEFRCPL